MKKTIICGCLVALLVGVAFVIGFSVKPHKIKVYQSPDTKHTIEVWADWEFSSVPGDSWSRGGFVVLRDQYDNVLQKKNTDAVIQIDSPRWFKDRVEIPLFVDWALTGNAVSSEHERGSVAR